MIIALHGFLGLPNDWLPFDGAFLGRDGKPQTIRKWSLYGDLPESPPAPDVYPLRVWAADFCNRIRSGWKAHGEGEKPILLGYSMGGRLALHALLEDPDLWAAGIVVGAHPGLTMQDVRLQRRLNDAQWAERFRSEDWTTLVRAWGEQDVFKTSAGNEDAIELVRHEPDYSRIQLARAMQLWSLASQENLRPYLADLKVPLLWVSGENDRRFRDLYRELRIDLIDSPSHSFVEVPGAGHRTPWDNPLKFTEEVQAFLSQVL